jgi:hypothetical protein
LRQLAPHAVPKRCCMHACMRRLWLTGLAQTYTYVRVWVHVWRKHDVHTYIHGFPNIVKCVQTWNRCARKRKHSFVSCSETTICIIFRLRHITIYQHVRPVWDRNDANFCQSAAIGRMASVVQMQGFRDTHCVAFLAIICHLSLFTRYVLERGFYIRLFWICRPWPVAATVGLDTPLSAAACGKLESGNDKRSGDVVFPARWLYCCFMHPIPPSFCNAEPPSHQSYVRSTSVMRAAGRAPCMHGSSEEKDEKEEWRGEVNPAWQIDGNAEEELSSNRCKYRAATKTSWHTFRCLLIPSDLVGEGANELITLFSGSQMTNGPIL